MLSEELSNLWDNKKRDLAKETLFTFRQSLGELLLKQSKVEGSIATQFPHESGVAVVLSEGGALISKARLIRSDLTQEVPHDGPFLVVL